MVRGALKKTASGKPARLVTARPSKAAPAAEGEAKPAEAKKVLKVISKKGQPVRLYTKAVHLGFQRSKRNQNPNVSLLKLEGVKDVDAAHYYLGKRVAFIYRATKRAGTKHRVMWGKITRTHGNSGAVRANFRHNLPPKSIGATLRVMMFPSRV